VALLAGRSVDLERVEPRRHGPGLWQAIGQEAALWAGTPVGPFDEASFDAWLADRSSRPDQALFAIRDKSAARSEIVGVLIVLSLLPSMGTAELGLVYGRALQRRIGGTEAVFLALRHLFESLGYRRVEWRCSPANAASMAAARRYGFTLEGVLRQHRWVKGANYDTAVHAIIDRDWPAIAGRFAAWLDPANFDGAGRQRQPLLAFAGS
jgi:RimJ/RimL family protein N-acetyltransferase